MVCHTSRMDPSTQSSSMLFNHQVHVNYHPEKAERLEAVFRYYVEGDKKALESFPDGSGMG